MNGDGTESKDGEKRNKWRKFFAERIILAPMVRENSLPFRLLCLDYGADLVYTEEIIDYKLISCQRLENKVLGTIDYVDKGGNIALRTCPALESSQLILQIGSNNPERAMRVAQMVARDVAGIDFNFGCPKGFSLSGGMGAALLEKPDQIRALLTKCIQNIDIPVTCKMRILPDLNRTLDLIQVIEKCGVSAIAVHGRTKEQRPRHENQDDVIRAITESASVPIIANGGSNHIKSHSDVLKFKEKTKASSVMIARAAMRNPSIFKPDNNLDPADQVIRKFLKLAVRYDNCFASTKYTVQYVVNQAHGYDAEFVQKFRSSNTFLDLCNLFAMVDWYEANKIKQSSTADYYPDDTVQNSEVEEIEQVMQTKKDTVEARGLKFICDSLPYNKRYYGNSTPKGRMNNYMNDPKRQNEGGELEIDIFHVGSKSRYFCLINFNGCSYLNKAYSAGKKMAEQATSMLVCEHLKLIDLTEYRSRMSANKKNVT